MSDIAPVVADEDASETLGTVLFGEGLTINEDTHVGTLR